MSSSSRSAPSEGLLVLAALAAAAFAPAGQQPACAGDGLVVSGTVAASPGSIEVTARIANPGSTIKGPLTVRGELLGQEDAALLERGIPAGETAEAPLEFSADIPRPGIHLLFLRIESPERAPDGGPRTTEVETAYLLLSLGAGVTPAVRLAADPVRLVDSGRLRVRIESADGAPHRVKLRALGPATLLFEPPGEPVAVPAGGAITATVRVLRGRSAWGARQKALVVASPLDGPLERTEVLAVPIEIGSDPAVLPRIRVPLAAAGVALILTALAIESRRWWRARRPGSRESER